jgi:hypothetical protein
VREIESERERERESKGMLFMIDISNRDPNLTLTERDHWIPKTFVSPTWLRLGLVLVLELRLVLGLKVKVSVRVKVRDYNPLDKLQT